MHAITQIDRMERMSDYLRGETVRSLDLLRDIDGTIESLILMRRQMDAFREAVEGLIKVVHAETKGIFSEDEIIPSLEQSQDVLKRLHDSLNARLKCARSAPELRSDDGVDDAYMQAIGAVLSYDESVERLRWSILEHNADMEGRKNSIVLTTDKDIDDLFDDL